MPGVRQRTQGPAATRSSPCPRWKTYGVAVSELAASCGMNYINGKDTVTYFGALFSE